jgi:hypothetical protein
VLVEPRQKISLLVTFLHQRQHDKILLFAATCAVVDYFAVILQHLGTRQPAGFIWMKDLKVFGLLQSCTTPTTGFFQTPVFTERRLSTSCS